MAQKPKQPPEDHQGVAWLRSTLPDDSVPRQQRPSLVKRDLAAMATPWFGAPISTWRVGRWLAHERTHNVPTKTDMVHGPPWRLTADVNKVMRGRLEEARQLGAWLAGIRMDTQAAENIAARTGDFQLVSLISQANDELDKMLDHLREATELASAMKELV